MNLIDFFKKESAVSATPVLFMSSLSGVANAAILFILNAVITSPAIGGLNFRFLMMFAACFGIFLIGKNYALKHTAVIVENILLKVRLRILDKTRQAALRQIETIGEAEIHTKLTHNVDTISESALAVVSACQSVIMLAFCSLYIAWLSLPAFLGSAGLISLSVLYYIRKQKEANVFLHASTGVQKQFFDRIAGILQGFKELKINRKRNDAYFREVEDVARKSEDLLIETQLRFVSGMVLAEVTFYSLMAAIVFLIPRFGTDYALLAPRLVTAILFIMGPVINIVAALPMITRSNVAIAEINGLENQLDASRDVPDIDSTSMPDSFRELVLENIGFSYRDRHDNTLFSLEAINLTVRKGELLFIVGGNGSGKSTILKILTGLYYPDTGAIRLDDKILTRSDYPSFRELFSIIFTDFHLFDKLYGLDIIDHERLAGYLKTMELDKKTTYTADTGFSTIKLSTGQKKRLAMIIALLFDSDIYVFDELAADQAPEFRVYFYEVLLAELRNRGKTVIVVSHDDRFFHVADRVIKMDYGRITSLRDRTDND